MPIKLEPMEPRYSTKHCLMCKGVKGLLHRLFKLNFCSDACKVQHTKLLADQGFTLLQLQRTRAEQRARWAKDYGEWRDAA